MMSTMSKSERTSDYLTSSQVEAEFGFPQGTLRRWRFAGNGPPFFKLEGSIRYLRGDVADWIAARRVDPAARAVG